MSKTPPKSYVYIITVFSLLILVYSFYVLYSALGYYQKGDTTNFYYGIFAGGVGMVLAISSFLHMRRRVLKIQKSVLKIMTTVICNKCDFKIVRRFGMGDYVHRQVGKCEQCDGTMSISSVYAEEPTKSGSSLFGM